VSGPENLVFASRSRIAEVRQENFTATIDLVFRAHPYYRALFARLGLAREDLRTLDDLRRLPLTWKRDYMARPEDFSLDRDLLEDQPIEARTVWDVMHTTGTSSGKPTPFVSTTWDFYNTLTANRRALEIRGVRPDDLVANLCPLTIHPYGAFARTLHACAVMKIPVVSALPGRPSPHFHWASHMDEVVDIVARTRATILWGVASYLRRVMLRAEEQGADLSAVRLVFAMGEPVSALMRDDMVARLRRCGAADPRVSVSYAATEMQVGAVECQEGSGYHNPAPEEFFFEVVHPETHEPLPEGESGLVVMTHLNRRGTVLLRYALGDTSRLSTEPCPHCGATTDRLTQLPFRSDDMVKVKGMLINPTLLFGAVQMHADVAEFQAVLQHEDAADPLSPELLILRVAPAGDARDLAPRIAASVKAAVGVTPLVEIVAKDAIYDPERSMKSKRLLDLRGR
jgi:phenylacetate-coenzyme A ligase PaaK-like adenylate-forming protein